MLDLNFIRENRELVEKSAREKGYKDADIAIDNAIKADDARKTILQKTETLRKERNDVAAQMKGGKPDPALIEKGKNLKQEIAK